MFLMDDHLASDNQPEVSSLWRTDSPSLSSHWLPVALHLGVDLCEISLTHVSVSTSMIAQVLFRQLYYWGVVGEGLLSCLGHSISQQFSCFSCFFSLWCFCACACWPILVKIQYKPQQLLLVHDYNSCALPGDDIFFTAGLYFYNSHIFLPFSPVFPKP